MPGLFRFLLLAGGWLGLDAVYDLVMDQWLTSPEERQTRQRIDLMKEARNLERVRSEEAAGRIRSGEESARFYADMQERLVSQHNQAIRGVMRGGSSVSTLNVGTGIDSAAPRGTVSNRQTRRSLTELLFPSYEEAEANKIMAMALQDTGEVPS